MALGHDRLRVELNGLSATASLVAGAAAVIAKQPAWWCYLDGSYLRNFAFNVITSRHHLLMIDAQSSGGKRVVAQLTDVIGIGVLISTTLRHQRNPSQNSPLGSACLPSAVRTRWCSRPDSWVKMPASHQAAK